MHAAPGFGVGNVGTTMLRPFTAITPRLRGGLRRFVRSPLAEWQVGDDVRLDGTGRQALPARRLDRGAATATASRGPDAEGATPPSQHDSDPTFVPRARGVRDGPWTDLDAELVGRATRDAARLARESVRHSPGTVVLGRPLAELEALMAELGEPLMSTTLHLPGDHLPLSDPYDIEERLSAHVDLILLAGSCGVEPSTVVDLVGEVPEVVRQGRGAVDWL